MRLDTLARVLKMTKQRPAYHFIEFYKSNPNIKKWSHRFEVREIYSKQRFLKSVRFFSLYDGRPVFNAQYDIYSTMRRLGK